MTYEPDYDGGSSRRHALWALVVIACLAILVACLMLFLGGSGNKPAAVDINPPIRTPSTTHSTNGTHSRHPASHHQTTTSGVPTSGPTTAPRSGNPCSSAASCVVAGDGGALAAANQYRLAHGQQAVPGSVTTNAQQCALSSGSGSSCVPHYAWTAVPDQDGKLAISKITGFGSGWLLDPSIKQLSAGWAYVHGSYECVLLKSP